MGDGEPRREVQHYLSVNINTSMQANRLKVHDALTILKLVFHPNPLPSGSDAQFELTIKANQSVHVNESALIFYSIEGGRVAIIDLRESGFPFKLKGGDLLHLRGVLKAAPLVENRYRIALYLDCPVYRGETSDLLELTISPSIDQRSYMRYAPQYRGWVELTATVSSSIDSGTSYTASELHPV
jgi:hypothetical protein